MQFRPCPGAAGWAQDSGFTANSRREMSFVLPMAQREELEPVHLDVVPVDRVFVVAAPNGGFAAGLFLASDRRSKSLRLFGRSKFSFLKDPFALTYDRPSIFLR